jgi:hypothetical protein
MKNMTCIQILLYDLFNDGWGDNIKMVIESPSEMHTENHPIEYYEKYMELSLNCSCMEIGICSSGFFNISVIAEGSPVRHPWEVLWTYTDSTGFTFVGSVGSSLATEFDEIIWYKNAIDYNVSHHVNDCDTCPPY